MLPLRFFGLVVLVFLSASSVSPLYAQPTDSQPSLGLTEPPPYQVGQVLDLFAAFQSGPADALDAVLTVTASAGVTFLGVTPVHPTQPLACVLNGPQEAVCTRDVVRGSSEIFIQFQFDAGGPQTFTATVGQSNDDPNPGNNTLEGTVNVEGGGASPGSISGTKWHDLNQNGTREGGEPGLAGWTIYVDENDNGQADGGEPSATTGADGSYQINDLNAGTYTVREVNQNGWQQTFPQTGAHAATVNAGATTADIDFGNVAIPQSADLSILLNASVNKMAQDDTLHVNVGDTLDVDVTATNHGPDDAEMVIVTIALDGNGSLRVLTESVDTCGGRATPSMPDDNTVQLEADLLSNDDSFSCHLKFLYGDPRTAAATTTISSITGDPNPGNNTYGIEIHALPLADLVVKKTILDVLPRSDDVAMPIDTVFVQDTLRYEVTITNFGPDEATNVMLTDQVYTDSLTFVLDSLPSGCAPGTGDAELSVIACTLGSLGANKEVTVRYQVVVQALDLPASSTKKVSNQVQVSSSQLDRTISDNTARVFTLVRGGSDLSVTKTASASQVLVGDTLSYTVTVTNHGPETAFLVETDDLVFADSLGFVADSVPINCTLGTATDDDTGRPLSTMQCRHAAILEPGESESATYNAVVKQVGIVSNEVEVIGFPGDPNRENNVAVVTTVVEPKTTIDFTLEAFASNNSVKEGDTVTFSFSCTPDQAADRCKVTATTSPHWKNPILGTGLFVANGTATPVDTNDEMKEVEVDPEGFPGGTRITYTFTGGFSEAGEAYQGSFTLDADKANPDASVLFEASAPDNEDPNEDDDIIEILVNIEALATAVERDGDSIPGAFRLHANYPNPFNPETTIRFEVKETSAVHLRVFNALGQAVRQLVDETLAPGVYRVVFDAHNLPSGLYLYQLEAGSFRKTQRMVLLK